MSWWHGINDLHDLILVSIAAGAFIRGLYLLACWYIEGKNP